MIKDDIYFFTEVSYFCCPFVHVDVFTETFILECMKVYLIYISWPVFQVYAC